MVAHGEGPYLGGVVVSNLLFLRIETHSLGDVFSTLTAPDVEWHFKPAAVVNAWLMALTGTQVHIQCQSHS
jgi:hypothetical protein